MRQPQPQSGTFPYEMYADCSEEILRYAMDYHVNLIAPSGLSDSEIDEFQSNMRRVMRKQRYHENLLEVTMM